ncbi:MAG: Unknown protein [uncultured Sulfurovum sp.]|uniref:YtkA-like domain-containing protein n=1 Tax=uncultured Sulfurovum sp. TaxID=269237 RepID=A0A6S6U7K6_9BACT|nr:MAG: Unknown protein [uncultured Sulfurovum sp.]
MTKKNQNRFWFLFVMGILSFGIAMVIWTVKQAVSIPVHESNNYMLKYQMADMNINEIMELEAKFKAKYKISLKNIELIELSDEEKNTNAKRAQTTPIKLTSGFNSFTYAITTHNLSVIDNAKVTFQLTRPHSRYDDYLEKNVKYHNNHYRTSPIELTKKGRYTLVLKVEIDDLIGYSEVPAYLNKM